jgi:nicotinamidase-related amidase
MKEWLKIVPEAERQNYARAGFHAGVRVGPRSALIVVDVTYGFCGARGLSLEEAIREFPTACGPVSWETMPQIARLVDLFREKKLPIVYTLSDTNSTPHTGSATKSNRTNPRGNGFNDFTDVVKPLEGEWILPKTKASGFFHTPLTTYLNRESVDTVLVCGVSTSGCVRATAVDACSHGYTTLVVDDCCFDRSYFAHCANLFDLDAKYASVVSLDELRVMMTRPALAVAS